MEKVRVKQGGIQLDWGISFLVPVVGPGVLEVTCSLPEDLSPGGPGIW